MKRVVLGLVAMLLAGTSAQAALVAPFTENFVSDAQSWRNRDGVTDGTWVSSGGVGGSSYVTFAATAGAATFVEIRGNATYPASGGNFSGDWLTAGVDSYSFYVKQDTGATMTIGARFTGAGGAVSGLSVPVASGVWTQLSYAIYFGNPNLISEAAPGSEALTFTNTFSNLQNLQVYVDSPNAPFTLGLDQVATTVPEPAAAGLVGAGGALVLGARRRRR